MQINRFCASGLDAVNMAAAQVMTGHHDMVVAGGVESMSRVGIGASGGAWPVDPQVAIPSYFMPQGISADLIATKYGISRDDCDAYAVESQKRTAEAWDEGASRNRSCRSRDINGLTILDRDEHPRPDTNMQSLAALKPSFEIIGQMGGFDAVADPGASRRGEGEARPPCRQFVRHRRRRRRGAGRQRGGRQGGRPEAARQESAPSPISAPTRR